MAKDDVNLVDVEMVELTSNYVMYEIGQRYSRKQHGVQFYVSSPQSPDDLEQLGRHCVAASSRGRGEHQHVHPGVMLPSLRLNTDTAGM